MENLRYRGWAMAVGYMDMTLKAVSIVAVTSYGFSADPNTIRDTFEVAWTSWYFILSLLIFLTLQLCGSMLLIFAADMGRDIRWAFRLSIGWMICTMLSLLVAGRLVFSGDKWLFPGLALVIQSGFLAVVWKFVDEVKSILGEDETKRVVPNE